MTSTTPEKPCKAVSKKCVRQGHGSFPTLTWWIGTPSIYTHLMMRLDINNPQSCYLQYRTGDHGWFHQQRYDISSYSYPPQIVNIKFHFNQEDTTSEPPTTPNSDEANTNDSDSHKAQSSHDGFDSKPKDSFASVFLHLLVEDKVDPETCLRAIFVRTLQDYDLDT
ncbi:hypothetical protein BS47DRAFT_1362342 [Hydnum rufescens UP504]|uniref:Uncharacterized protein n=1 Tax=Hydnum rufescens UP504 TaxID=1448309 RepID=A0A9P6AXI6_9AGAM|nr:hypothetical protein BS47DRAFT_1362342 [Hydnum rufescens UP504]